MNWYKYNALTDTERQSLQDLGGSNVVEEINIGGYDLFLATVPPVMAGLPEYQIGLKRQDLDISTPERQFEKQDIKIPEEDPISILRQMQDKIGNWINQYGSLLAASMNPDKNKQYLSLLSSLGFSVDNIDLGHGTGFIINQ